MRFANFLQLDPRSVGQHSTIHPSIAHTDTIAEIGRWGFPAGRFALAKGYGILRAIRSGPDSLYGLAMAGSVACGRGVGSIV